MELNFKGYDMESLSGCSTKQLQELLKLLVIQLDEDGQKEILDMIKAYLLEPGKA